MPPGLGAAARPSPGLPGTRGGGGREGGGGARGRPSPLTGRPPARSAARGLRPQGERRVPCQQHRLHQRLVRPQHGWVLGAGPRSLPLLSPTVGFWGPSPGHCLLHPHYGWVLGSVSQLFPSPSPSQVGFGVYPCPQTVVGAMAELREEGAQLEPPPIPCSHFFVTPQTMRTATTTRSPTRSPTRTSAGGRTRRQSRRGEMPSR